MIDDRRDYWFSSADESAAVEFALYCGQWAEMMKATVKALNQDLEDDRGYRFTNYVVEFPNASRINCMSSNPRRFRSKGGDVCLDEFDWHDQPGEMLDAATPVTTWGYDLTILTTRNGEGSQFDTLVKLARRIATGEITPAEAHTLEWSYHFTPITVAVAQGLAEKIRKLDHVDEQVRAEFIDECRAKSRNEDAFNQEYMCQPSALASTLIPYDLYQACESDECLQPAGDGDKYLGFDVGREHDKTTIWILERVGDVLVTRKVQNLRGERYGVQEQILIDHVQGDPKIRRLCGDATGIGDMLVEKLQDRFGANRVEKVKFTAPAKEHLANQALARFQDRRVRVPADRTIRESCHSIRKTTTVAGNTRYDAARTEEGHGDEFWAFALALEAAGTGNIKPEIFHV